MTKGVIATPHHVASEVGAQIFRESHIRLSKRRGISHGGGVNIVVKPTTDRERPSKRKLREKKTCISFPRIGPRAVLREHFDRRVSRAQLPDSATEKHRCEHGKGKRKHGERGEDRVIAVPPGTVVLGIDSNRSFLASVLAHPVFVAGGATTAFIDRHCSAQLARRPVPGGDIAALAAALLFEKTATQQDSMLANWSSTGALAWPLRVTGPTASD